MNTMLKNLMKKAGVALMVSAIGLSAGVETASASINRNSTVQARDTNVHTFRIDGDDTMRVRFRLVGDGDTDLDIFVYDENYNLLCQGVTRSDREICSFRTDDWVGDRVVRVRVKNLGRIYNEYTLSAEAS